jgi:hypothetical protein
MHFWRVGEARVPGPTPSEVEDPYGHRALRQTALRHLAEPPRAQWAMTSHSLWAVERDDDAAGAPPSSSAASPSSGRGRGVRDSLISLPVPAARLSDACHPAACALTATPRRLSAEAAPFVPVVPLRAPLPAQPTQTDHDSARGAAILQRRGAELLQRLTTHPSPSLERFSSSGTEQDATSQNGYGCARGADILQRHGAVFLQRPTTHPSPSLERFSSSGTEQDATSQNGYGCARGAAIL